MDAPIIEARFAELKSYIDRWWTDSAWPLEQRITYSGHLIETEEHRRIDARCALDRDERQWAEAKEALIAWEAILDARDAKVPLPRWVVAYLEESAFLLLSGRLGQRPRKQRPGLLYEALGFRNPGPGHKADVYDKQEDAAKGIQLAMELWREQWDGKRVVSHPTARRIVADRNEVSTSTVDNAWARWGRSITSEASRLRHKALKQKAAQRRSPK